MQMLTEDLKCQLFLVSKGPDDRKAVLTHVKGLTRDVT